MEQKIRSRIEWAKEDVREANKKLLQLIKDIQVLNWDLWNEITEHLANAESHLHNALTFDPLPTLKSLREQYGRLVREAEEGTPAKRAYFHIKLAVDNVDSLKAAREHVQGNLHNHSDELAPYYRTFLDTTQK